MFKNYNDTTLVSPSATISNTQLTNQPDVFIVSVTPVISVSPSIFKHSSETATTEVISQFASLETLIAHWRGSWPAETPGRLSGQTLFLNDSIKLP